MWGMKHASNESALALKPRVAITRSPKHLTGVSVAPQKGPMSSKKIFKKEKIFFLFNVSIPCYFFQSNFPDCVLRPGKPYQHTTWYKFSIDKQDLRGSMFIVLTFIMYIKKLHMHEKHNMFLIQDHLVTFVHQVFMMCQVPHFCDVIASDVNKSALRLFSLQERKKDVKTCCYGTQNIRWLVIYLLSLFKGKNKIRTKS